MSVQDKLTGFQAHRDEVRSKRREFEAYADEFDAASARKGDTTDLQAAISELRQEFATTRGVFDEYNKRFTDRVKQTEDISALLAAADQLEAGFESIDDRFNSYLNLFRDDVEDLSDITEFQDEIEGLRAALVSIPRIFDEYRHAFEADLNRFHDAIKESRRAFEATQQDFQVYSEEIQSDIEALRNPTDFLESIDQMQASVASREASFQTYATGAFQGQLSAFTTAVADTRDSYDETERRFAAYIGEFHGSGQLADTTTETEEPEPDSEPSSSEKEIAIDSTVDAEPEVGFVEKATDKSAPTSETATAGDSPTTDDASSTGDADAESQPNDMISCEVCGEYYKAITEPHLQTHGMTIDDYREEFGEDAPLRPGDQ